MKALSLALLLFALFTLSTNLELSTADNVYDTEGNPLVSGASYYASYYQAGAGPVKPSQVGNETEPISVVLGTFLDNPKWPVKFILSGNDTNVTTGSSMDIEFTSAPANVSSTQWTVGEDYLVRIDNEETLAGTFTIEKLSSTTGSHGNTYQIVFHVQGGFSMPLYKKEVDSENYQLLATFGSRILPFVFEIPYDDQVRSGKSAI